MKKFFFVGASLLLLFSCQKEKDIVFKDIAQGESFLVFSNRDDVDRASTGNLSTDLRGVSIGQSYEKRRLGQGDTANQNNTLSVLVPEEGFRKLLNSKGEIQVGDTIYCISKYGTFYAHSKDLQELRATVLSYKGGQDDEEYEHIGSVSLFKTFKGIPLEELEEQETFDDETRAMNFSGQRPRILDLDISSFPRERASRKTWAGKLLQSVGVRKSIVKKFPNNSSRRLNCAVFDYNYLIRHSTGVTAKTQKKMWYGGWGKLKNIAAEEIIVGCRYAILKVNYPSGITQDVYKIFGSLPAGESRFDSYTRGLPLPSWFKTQLINVTIPIISKEVTITLEDAVRITSNRVKAFMRGAVKKISPREPFLTIEKRTEEELDTEIARLRMNEFLPVTVPIYAKDAIYLFVSNVLAANTRNNAEATMRFSDGFLSVLLGYKTFQGNFGASLKNFKPAYDVGFNFNKFAPEVKSLGFETDNFIIKASAPKESDVELVAGEFFAAGSFDGRWIGHRLYW